MAVQGDISFGLSIGAGQSVRRNAGDSAFEAYTPTPTPTEDSLLSTLTVFADSKNDTGFYDNTNISVTYDKTARTITLTRTGGVIYYFQGKKYTLTSPWTSSAHTNAAGNYFLYSTDGTTFSWSTTTWTFDNIMVALAIYDGSDGWAIREVHGMMDAESHKNAHNNIGTWRSSGGILTAGTYTENTATDAANSPGFDLAVVNDEDIATTIPAWTEGTYTTMYIGASSTATFSTVATLPFTSAGSYIQVNDATTGSLTAGINNRYYNVYQILVPAAADTDSQKRRMIMLQPQATFTSLTSAQAEDTRSLSLGNFATTAPEFTIYARITYVTSAGDGNTGKCRIATGGVSYVVGNRISSSSLTGSPTNHAGLTNLSWTSSGHTGSNLGAPLFDATGIATQVVPTASQSIRINAGGTAWEAYTPSSGVSWGTSINGATGTGLALSLDNSYAAGGIGQSITIGNTQTQALKAMSISTGTSTHTHIGLFLDSDRGFGGNRTGITTRCYSSAGTNSVVQEHGIGIGDNYNSNSSFNFYSLSISNIENAGSGSNTGINVINYSTTFATNFNLGQGIAVRQFGVGGTGLFVYGQDSINTSTNGLVNYTLSNTQSGATVMQKIDLGTSAQGHAGLLINQFNASFSSTGLKIDRGTTGTGYGISVVGGGLGNNGRLINGTYSVNSTLTSKTEKDYEFSTTRTHSGTTTITDNFDMCSYTRTNRTNNASANLTTQGTVLKLENVATQTAGTLTDSVTPLLIVQDADSTGVPIKITQAAVVSTNFKKIIEGDGITIWKSDGTTPNGALSGTAGDICLNGPSGQTFYCAGTTTWTGM